MSLDRVSPGKKLPEDFNVIIEIPMNADPVKYEVDKDSGAIFVDRFMLTAMHYPCNYGYIPQTLSEDGDPADVLVLTPFPIQIGAVVRCRAIGVLEMDDESGGDAKLLAVPIEKLYPRTAISSRTRICPRKTSPASSISSSTTRTWKRASGSRSRAGRAWTPLTKKSCAAPSATPRADRATRQPASCRPAPTGGAAATARGLSPPRRCLAGARSVRSSHWPQKGLHSRVLFQTPGRPTTTTPHRGGTGHAKRARRRGNIFPGYSGHVFVIG